MRKNGIINRSFYHLRNFGLLLITVILSFWFIAILLFSFLPVPYSTVMLERQINAWLSNNKSFHLESSWRNAQQIAPELMLAVIAAEDQRFPKHIGFDLHSVQQVIFKQNSRPLRGASTISQQTAKNLFLWDGRSLLRKGLEVIITAGIEIFWTKQRILTVYLNIAEFGPGIFGAEAASQHYFHTSAKELTAAQAAMLAAILPNPLHWQADRPTRYLLKRQQWILQQMQHLGERNFLIENRLYSSPSQ
jgi:monofunctional glycosyltransferase